MSKGHQLRVLHAAVSMNPSSGVIKQMEWEQQAANKLAIPWTSVLHTAKKMESDVAHVWSNLPKIKLFQYFILRMKFYQWLEVTSEKYDLILLRFSVHDPLQTRLAKKIGYKLLTIHHTKEEAELTEAGGVIGQIKNIIEVIWGRRTLRSIKGTVSVTPEIDLCQKSRAKLVDSKLSYLYPNGICYATSPVSDLRAGKVPEIIFVASHFAHWHGLDLLIAEVKKNTDEFKIHLVGNVSSEDVYTIDGDARFVLHGQLNTNEIHQLTRKMWVGLSSFALERQDMLQACTLKVREYLQMGLCVYAGHQDTGLPDDFAFYKQGSPNPNDILAYARQMRSISRAGVSVAAAPYISKPRLLSRLYAQLQTDFPLKLSKAAS